jgi:hypothetical protein
MSYSHFVGCRLLAVFEANPNPNICTKGIKGNGTYKCKPEGDSVNCDIEGEYTLPAR